MKKTYITPKAQVYVMKTTRCMLIGKSEEPADDSEIYSNKYCGGGSLWDDSEPAEPEQNSMY